MRRLLEHFDRVFDLDCVIGGARLGDAVETLLDHVDAQAMPEFGSEGDPGMVADKSNRFVRFYYRPHLFPGMEADLRLAHQLQFHLLPRALPTGAPVSIAAVLESYCHLSGDLFGWETLRDGRFLIWIIDTAGHGVRSGLCSAVLKILIDRARERSRVGELLGEISRSFDECVKERHSSLFATGVFIAMDTHGALTYSSAGHPPFLLRRTGGQIEELGSLGRPIGLLPGSSFASRDLSLTQGDALLLYTDGLVETKSLKGEEFGFDRVRDLFGSDFDVPEEMTGSIYREIATRAHLPKLDDDVTFLVARFD